MFNFICKVKYNMTRLFYIARAAPAPESRYMMILEHWTSELLTMQVTASLIPQPSVLDGETNILNRYSFSFLIFEVQNQYLCFKNKNII